MIPTVMALAFLAVAAADTQSDAGLNMHAGTDTAGVDEGRLLGSKNKKNKKKKKSKCKNKKCTRDVCRDGKGRRRIGKNCCACPKYTPSPFPTTAPTTAPTTSPTTAPSAASLGDAVGGATGTLAASHFWDCNGGACDATTMDPWNEEKFVYASQYAPVDPADYGGASYGESIWATGAFSDTLSNLMGDDETDPNCGTVVEYVDGVATPYPGGCGKCLLVKNSNAVNSDWSAVVMKKSRCPPESNGCEDGNAHLDIAAPGYDYLTESTASVCGSDTRTDTILTSAQASTCGAWWNSAGNTQDGCDCSTLPSSTAEEQALKKGCEQFTEWGWKSGNPDLTYEVVTCPSAFLSLVGGAFDASGVVSMSRRALRGV